MTDFKKSRTNITNVTKYQPQVVINYGITTTTESYKIISSLHIFTYSSHVFNFVIKQGQLIVSISLLVFQILSIEFYHQAELTVT